MLPSHREYNSTRKKKTSKMKKLRNYPQLNQQKTHLKQSTMKQISEV